MELRRVIRCGRWLWSSLAGLILALSIPALSSAATIDFEDRPDGDTVNTDYSSQGVTFNDPVASSYPGFAHSGSKAIELCTVDPEGCSFAAPPVRLRVNFTSGQTTVGIWVGNQNTGPSRTVRLTAFDANGTELGHQDATLPAGSPVTNHLTVTAAGPNIRRFEVAATDNSGIFKLVFDDVEFTAAGPPPPCGATGPPTVTLTSPPGGARFQNNSIPLAGTVDGHGAPITDATVVSLGPTTTRTAIGFPTPVGPGGGNFAINMNGLLQLGDQKVYVTATNCAGTGVSGNPIVTYSPLPPTAGFQQLAPVEVVQTVQEPYNPVPLVASTQAGTKRTIARVELAATGVTGPITGLSGRLTATRLDGSRPGGPLAIDSLNTISVGANQTLDQARHNLGGTLNFELPAQWLTEGRLHLQLEQLKIEGAQTALPCQYCDNYGGQQATVTFHRVPPARIWLVGVPYTTTVNGTLGTFSPRQKDFDFLASWLRRAYPASEIQITQSALPTVSDQPGYEDDESTSADEHRDGFLCDDVNSRLSDFVQTIPAQPQQTRYYGVVSDAGGNLFMRGCSNIGGRFGSGPAGANGFAWDKDGAYTDWYGGHEIGHMYNRKHPDGGCEDSDDDGSFPFQGGLIGNSVFDNQGIDVGDASLFPVQDMELHDWPAWHDVMTYCDNQWLSSYTYNGILKNLCGGEVGNCPDHAALTKRRSAKRGGPRLAVHGTLNLANSHVTLDPMSALAGLTPTERPKKSRYAIVLRGAGGGKVGNYPFDPQEISDAPNGERLATIDAVVPFPRTTKRIEIVGKGRVLASRRVSDHAPEVSLRSPKAKRLHQPVKLRWRRSDRDRGKILSTVQYAADGKHYTTIAAGLRKSSYRVDPATLPGGKRARLRVVVTDGVLTGVDASKRFAVAAKPPRISIATPVDGARLTEGQSVQLVASVLDDQDAQLGNAVVWTSDRQGELGRGASLSATLEPGAHTITATVTNSLGATSTATVHVDVAAIPATVNAQLIP